MPKKLPSTKYFQVARELRDQIRQLTPGLAMPTQRELMRSFGASQATIERAMKRLHKEGLVHRPAGTRRVVVRRQADPATLRLCLIRPDWPSPLYDSISRSIAAAGKARNWAFTHVTYRSMEMIDFESIALQDDAAVLMTSSEPVPERLLRVLAKPPIPLVVAQNHWEGIQASTVCINDRQMARTATRYLLELGHPRPMIAVPVLTRGSMQHSVQGWREAMEAAGIREDLDSLIIDARTQPQSDVRYIAYERWKTLLAGPGPRPSAIYCANSATSLGVLRALREAGLRVPQDVSVVGADAISGEGPFMNPALTATSVDMARYGESLAMLIEGQVDGTITESRQLWLDAELTVRESAAPYQGKPGL